MTVVTSSAELLDALRTVSMAVSAGERAAGWDLAQLVTNLEGQIASGALAMTWDASVTSPDGQAVDAIVTHEGSRVVVEVETLVEEDGGAFAIDLDALAAAPVAPPSAPAAPSAPPSVPSVAPVVNRSGPSTDDADLYPIFYPSELNGASLTTTRAWLAERKVTGANCPACGQFAKLYTRKMNSGQARSLILMYRVGGPEGTDWTHLPTKVGSKSREEGKLKHWGLVEQQTKVMGKDGRRGVWRLTSEGVDFALCEGTVPQAIRLYNADFRGTTGPQISILDAIGTKFDYDKLMAG